MTKRLLSIMAFLVASLFSTAGISATVSATFTDNDCAGYFGTGFEACTIFIDVDGQHVELSPVIAKYDVNDDGSFTTEVNSSLFGSVDGSEFSISMSNDWSGSWSYDRGQDDPGVRFWVAKAASGFTLFWDVDQTVIDSGICSAANYYTLDCLAEANVVTAGSYTTVDHKGLSHITFYDSVDPHVVPVPAAVWLMGSGLIGLVAVARRRK